MAAILALPIAQTATEPRTSLLSRLPKTITTFRPRIFSVPSPFYQSQHPSHRSARVIMRMGDQTKRSGPDRAGSPGRPRIPGTLWSRATAPPPPSNAGPDCLRLQLALFCRAEVIDYKSTTMPNWLCFVTVAHAVKRAESAVMPTLLRASQWRETLLPGPRNRPRNGFVSAPRTH